VLQKEIEVVDGDVGISQHLDNVGLRVWKYENGEHFVYLVCLYPLISPRLVGA